MLNLTAFKLSRGLHHCTKLQFHIANSASWSHVAPLSIAVARTSDNLHHRSLFKHNLTDLQVKQSFHTSPKRQDIVSNLMEEAQKRYKHMLSQVDWQEVKRSPQPALVYGAAGLIPFVFPPVAILFNGAFLPNLAFVQLAYGASILSFLGGVKWGFSVLDSQKLTWDNLGQSVSLSLLAFGSLLLPPWLGTIALMGGLGVSAYIDIVSRGYPQWFKAMRLCLSSVAIGSLAFGLILRLLL